MDAIFALQARWHEGRELIYIGRSSGLYRCDLCEGIEHNLFVSHLSDASLPTTALIVRESLIMAGIPGAILRSSDGGEMWHITHLPMPAPTVTALLIAPNGGLVAATLEDGVFAARSINDIPEPRNYGLLDSRVMALAAARGGLVFAATLSGLFVSATQGLSWCETDFSLPTFSLATTQSADLLIGTESNGLWRWSSGSWERVFESSIPINVLACEADGRQCFAAVANRLLISTDGGCAWQESAGFDAPITALALSPASQGRRVWVGVGADLIAYDID